MLKGVGWGLVRLGIIALLVKRGRVGWDR